MDGCGRERKRLRAEEWGQGGNGAEGDIACVGEHSELFYDVVEVVVDDVPVGFAVSRGGQSESRRCFRYVDDRAGTGGGEVAAPDQDIYVALPPGLHVVCGDRKSTRLNSSH